MDAFMSAIFGAKEVKAVARVKMSESETRTVTLHTMPDDASEAAFAEAAKLGVDLAVRVRDEERTRTIGGKGVFGAAAVSATCSVLGYVPEKAPKKPKEQKDSKPKDGAATEQKEGAGTSIG